MPPNLLSANLPRHPNAVERLRLARQLVETELRRVAIGERLPSVRELRQRCGVGLAQLQSMLAELEQEGVLERRLRSGLYKVRSPQPEQQLRMIDLIACGRLTDIRSQNKQTFTSRLIEALAAEAGEQGMPVRLHQVYAWDSVARYETIAKDPSVRSCILLCPHLPELSAIFEHHGARTIALFPKQQQTQGASICDAQDMVQLQLDHLWELGHRRIAYMDHVIPQFMDMVFLQRRETFYRLMAHRGAKVQPHWVFRVPQQVPDGAAEDRRQAVLASVFDPPGRPTAVILGDLFALSIYRFAQTRGWRVGRDLSVVGTDDVPVASMLEPPLTTVHNDRNIAARMAIDSLRSLMEGKKIPQLRHVPLQWVNRTSTGPCPPDASLDEADTIKADSLCSSHSY